MHLGLRELERFFRAHRKDAFLVLATVVATEGSTYRKPGAMMLIRENLEFAGLISGGCLEGDLVEHAAAEFADGIARRVTYDLSSDEQAIWSLGLGCGGVVRLLLQRLDRDAGFGILPRMFDSIGQRHTNVLALLWNPADGLPLGTAALVDDAGVLSGDARVFPCLEGQPGAWSSPKRFRYTTLENGQADDAVLLVRIEPSPCILVCGAGPDAVPVARQVEALGWAGIVVDHRPAYAEPDRFPAATQVIRLAPADLERQVDLAAVDAAVVMTHNLEHDKTYLEQLASRKLAYLGLLGPRARREELQVKLGIGDGLIHGPAGLDIGAELPAAIALSVVAQMHLVLSRKGDG
jgi:xanthine/CO dehydrogenase XdhC/CoxF family maturation factor